MHLLFPIKEKQMKLYGILDHTAEIGTSLCNGLKVVVILNNDVQIFVYNKDLDKPDHYMIKNDNRTYEHMKILALAILSCKNIDYNDNQIFNLIKLGSIKSKKGD